MARALSRRLFFNPLPQERSQGSGSTWPAIDYWLFAKGAQQSERVAALVKAYRKHAVPAAADDAGRCCRAGVTLGQVPRRTVSGMGLVDLADPPESLLDHGVALAAPNGAIRRVRVLEGAPYQQRLRVRLEGSKTGMRLWRFGWQVQIARSELPRLRKTSITVTTCGALKSAMPTGGARQDRLLADLPGGAVMVFKGAAGGREYWVPTAPQHMLKVHAAERWISVDWPAERLED